MVRTILCPIDFSSLSLSSVGLAVEMCLRTGARLVLEHNEDCRPPSYLTVGWMWSEEHEVEERDRSRAAADRLQRLFEEIPEEVEHEAKLTRGPVEQSLLYLAKHLPADLIVMGTHGPSNAKHRSITERVILSAPCPVLATGEGYVPETRFGVPGEERSEDLTVLVPFDFTDRSQACARLAFAMMRGMPHRMELLHVVPARVSVKGEPEGRFEVEEAIERLRGFVPAELEDRVSVRVLPGRPSERILERALEKDALFILMAAHGKSAFKRFLFGTTTLEVLHGSSCPVWFVPPAVCRDPAWAAA